MEAMNLMMEGGEGGEMKIFREDQHSTWENYFSGDQIMNCLGRNVFESTMTCRRDRLLGDIEGR